MKNKFGLSILALGCLVLPTASHSKFVPGPTVNYCSAAYERVENVYFSYNSNIDLPKGLSPLQILKDATKKERSTLEEHGIAVKYAPNSHVELNNNDNTIVFELAYSSSAADSFSIPFNEDVYSELKTVKKSTSKELV